MHKFRPFIRIENEGAVFVSYVFKNLKNFIHCERLIFIVAVVCIIASSFIVNFSYGLYYNYSVKITEAEIDTKDLDTSIAEGVTLTKGELQSYAEALDEKTLNGMTVIYAAARIPEFADETTYGPMAMRFVIHNGSYGICEVTKENYERHGMISSGRYITNEEEAEGSLCALMWGESEDSWNEAGEMIKNPDGTVRLFGKDYKVVGTYRGGMGTPIVPFLTVPNDLVLSEIGFSFEKNITRSAYDDMVKKAELIIPNKIVFPELEFPDNDTIAVYNNMLSVSLVLSVISVANFALLFWFILQKRQRRLAIMRISGCTRLRAALMYLCECSLLVLPCYAVGAALNMLLCRYVFGKAFEFFAQAYSSRVYLTIFGLYALSFAVITLIMVIAAVRKTLTSSLKEAV